MNIRVNSNQRSSQSSRRLWEAVNAVFWLGVFNLILVFALVLAGVMTEVRYQRAQAEVQKAREELQKAEKNIARFLKNLENLD